MGRAYKKDNLVWKRQFGFILKRLFSLYALDYLVFADKYGWSSSTVRYWFIGRNLPQREGLISLKRYFVDELIGDKAHNKQFYEEVKTFFEEQNTINVYYTLKRNFPNMSHFAGEVLSVCYDFAKGRFSSMQLVVDEIQPTGKTQAVIFTFDGVLTIDKADRTIWEKLWIKLGYTLKMCKELQLKYDRNEISHKQWCKLTEEKFCERNLNKKHVDEVVSQICLIKGIRETFQKLENKNIKIYIVSESISTIIRSSLKDLCQYVEIIKANEFRFDLDGVLVKIIDTKYDLEGKANLINEIAEELQISPHDILYVGNSANDRYVHCSGARTLCINPKLTDITDKLVWNNCILACENLTEILNYL